MFDLPINGLGVVVGLFVVNAAVECVSCFIPVESVGTWGLFDKGSSLVPYKIKDQL